MPPIRPFAFWATAALCSTAALAQGDPKAHPGTLSAKPDVGHGKQMPPGAQRTLAFASAQRVLDLLRSDAALANPIGYSVVLRRLASERLSGDAPGMPYHEAVLGELTYFGLEDNGHGGKEIGPTGGIVSFHVAINTVGSEAEIESTDEEADHGPRIMYDLKKTGDFRGRPVYNGACTYVSRGPAPPVVPLTKERYYTLELLKAKAASSFHAGQHAATTSTPASDGLQKFLRDRPQREASNRKTIDALRAAGADAATIQQMTDAFHEAEKQQEAGLRGAVAGGSDQNIQDIVKQGREAEAAHIAELRSSLDALSPEERKSPAYLIDHGRGYYTLGSKADEDVILPMQPNPAFYDASLSPNLPQVLWICLPGLQGVADSTYQTYAGEEREQERATAERHLADAIRVRDKLDWAALEALVKP